MASNFVNYDYFRVNNIRKYKIFSDSSAFFQYPGFCSNIICLLPVVNMLYKAGTGPSNVACVVLMVFMLHSNYGI